MAARRRLGELRRLGPGFDGTVLVRDGDVVVVTINHQLNLFGYIKLDDPDDRFAQSGNAGVLDMVAALRWVKANAAAFGGDPGNVTIFGQSGGGAKALSVRDAAQSCWAAFGGTWPLTDSPVCRP